MMRNLLGALALLLPLTAARAHEFMVIPSAAKAPVGQTMKAALFMTETFISPDRMPPAENVTLEWVHGDKREPLKVTPAEKQLDVTVVVPKGAFALSASLVRTRMERPKGPKKEEGAATEGRMTRSAAFSKSFVNLKPESTFWAQPVGSRLELIPQANPATLKTGTKLQVKALFDGKPVAALVQATFDRKGEPGKGFAVKTRSGDDGLAEVTLDRPGLWVIRVKHGVEEAKDGYAFYAGSANLTLRVE
ncbi:DUF4198 domain-containing protein [Myxococcus vastator]|uniref:DUF4198 domain-containing protein n=1 Tax=Myxococcus vastator TaxID=2709664 RepID=UPI0013CF43F2|nr:DUF4198 domain-containing protein [Myxococcus vastator]